MKRALTTSYHPQADGQTEVMNQTLEVSLRAYIGPNRDDWADKLDPIALAYNTSIHTATGMSPAYLLYGYHPITASCLRNPITGIPRAIQDKNAGGENVNNKKHFYSESGVFDD